MTAMLITTSRKPGQLTRAIARTLANGMGAEFLNRGKSGVDSVFAEAEKLGVSKVLFVWERNGNPSRLVAFDMEKAAEMPDPQNEGEGDEGKEGEAEERERNAGGNKMGDRGKGGQSGVSGGEGRSKASKTGGAEIEGLGGEAGGNGEDDEGRRRKGGKGKNKEREGGQGGAEDPAWLKPELRLGGAVFPRIPVRRKGCRVVAEDAFGKEAAKLFSPSEGPNKILLSRFGLKLYLEGELLLELRFTNQ